MLVLLLSAALCAALIGVVQVRSMIEARSASAEAAGYTPPPLPSATPGSVPADLVAVIGDEWAAPRNTVTNRPWSYLLQRSLGVRVRVFGSDGGAYLGSSVGAGGAPFASAVDSVPPTATVVVFFGGAHDAGDPPAALAASATQALADAARRAPRARLVVVAPVPTRPGRTGELAQVRAVLRTVAQTARVGFVDPVQDKWLTSASMWSRSAPAPSQAGNQQIANRMGDVVRPLLARRPG